MLFLFWRRQKCIKSQLRFFPDVSTMISRESALRQLQTVCSDLMQTEQVEVEEKALRYIAKAADGSMRDALSLLDQCIAFYLGQKLTYDHVLGSTWCGGYGCVQPPASESIEKRCCRSS